VRREQYVGFEAAQDTSAVKSASTELPRAAARGIQRALNIVVVQRGIHRLESETQIRQTTSIVLMRSSVLEHVAPTGFSEMKQFGRRGP
jgi:hypothetical protein